MNAEHKRKDVTKSTKRHLTSCSRQNHNKQSPTAFPLCTKKHLCEQDMSYTGALYLTKVIQIIIFQAQPSNGRKP